MPAESSRDQEELDKKGAKAYEALVKGDDAERARREEEEGLAVEAHRFQAVASAMNQILGTGRNSRMTLQLPEGLTAEEQRALEWLHAARFGRDREVAGYLSALERKQELNKALAILQPVLAFGVLPGNEEMHKAYQSVAGKVVSLRGEIKQAIMAELKRKGPKKKPKRDEPKDDEEDDEQDDDETAAGDESEPEEKKKSSLLIDDEVAQVQQKKMGVLKRLFRRDKGAGKEESEEES